MTTNPDRWMGLLHRLGQEPQIRDLIVFPLEIRLITSGSTFLY